MGGNSGITYREERLINTCIQCLNSNLLGSTIEVTNEAFFFTWFKVAGNCLLYAAGGLICAGSVRVRAMHASIEGLGSTW